MTPDIRHGVPEVSIVRLKPFRRKRSPQPLGATAKGLGRKAQGVGNRSTLQAGNLKALFGPPTDPRWAVQAA